MFFVAIPAGLLYASERDPWPAPGPLLWLGVAVVALSQVVVAVHVAAFVREGRGTHVPLDPPRELIRSRLYGRIRNPMYLVYALAILGLALVYRSWLLLAYCFAFWLAAHVYVVAVEEKTLRRRFGEAYEAYCARVPRWLPRLVRRSRP